MSNSALPRIKRGTGPKAKLTSQNYRSRALPFLLEDFKERCGYSMRHVLYCGKKCLEIDHFNSQAKANKRHLYSNLILAHRICNNKKQDFWPTAKERRDGIRYINPCEEADYDFQIFENPDTHELVGTTPAAKYHILMLDLNDPSFVQERKDRSDLANCLEGRRPAVLKGGFSELSDGIKAMREMLNRMIPLISPPP